jgi:hypothetical protein
VEAGVAVCGTRAYFVRQENAMAAQGPKPYVKLASTLVLLGMGLFTLERYGLSRIEEPGHPLHLDGTILSLLVIVPLALVATGALIFVYGKMRRL